MKIWQKWILKTIAGIITFCFLFLVITSTSAFTDFSTTLSPGWHTTIYPFGGAFCFTIVIACGIIVLNLIFRWTLKLLNFVFAKIFW